MYKLIFIVLMSATVVISFAQSGNQISSGNWLPVILAVFAVVIGMQILMVKVRNGRLNWRLAAKLPEPEANQYAGFLNRKFVYFKMLNESEQKTFIDRVDYIRNEKNFVAADMEVTEDMKTLFSASLAQLTFGLDDFSLPELKIVQFTPGPFYSDLIGREVKGLTFERGTIMLSWKDFEQGYLAPDDKINLGLHEMAHALWLYKDDTYAVAEHFNEWHVSALMELQKMRNGGGNGFLRDYASTSLEEFWAVSVECFFEAPVDFRNAIPALYEKTCLILNQDMASRYEAYKRGRLISTVS